MSDIGLFVGEGSIDIKIENGDLAADNGLETAVLISLFSDKRVNDGELPKGETSKRGWWGDLFSDFDGDKIGSKLWLLDREKQLNENLPRYESFCLGALKWLVDDGVASDIFVNATYPNKGELKIEIKIQKPDGNESKFGFLWDGQKIKRG